MAHYLIMMMITLSFIRYLHICILLALISITRFWQMYVKCYSFSEAYTSVELLLHNRPLEIAMSVPLRANIWLKMTKLQRAVISI